MHTETTNERILVIANETAATDTLIETVVTSAPDGHAQVLAIAPALNSRVRHWTSDEDPARRRAKERLQTCVGRLQAAGIDATGMIGDADPVQALRDALAFFDADVLVIATHPEGRSHWLADDLLGRARRHFGGPILHVTVASAPELAAAA
jgi:nucleotide-binding universal stress UspA family protein